MNIILTFKRAQAGWSLIELVLVTAIMGILSIGAWLALAPNNREQDLAAAESESLTRAHHALLGFALVHHRLPYADQSTERLGMESPEAIKGWLAVRTLGLPVGLHMDYAVDPILAETPRIRFSPAVSSSSMPATVRTQPNGFDFCSALVTAQRRGTLIATDVPIAYALLHRSAFNNGMQTSPDHILQLPGDDNAPRSHHKAIGAAELIQTLRCPTLLTRAAAIATQARAAEELPRLANEYREYRDMRHRAAMANEFGAQVEVALDGLSMILTAFDIALARLNLLLLDSSDPAIDRVVAKIKLGNSILTMTRLATGLALDAQSLAQAPKDTASAATALSRAYRWEVRVQNYAHHAAQHANEQLERGLLP